LIHGVSAFCCGQVGSNISPYKSMHYPFLFYYFGKKGMGVEDSLANTTKCSIVYGFTTTCLYTVFFIICHVNKLTIDVNGYTLYIELATLVGWIVNVAQIAFYLILAYNEKVHDLFIKIGTFFLVKFKKVKDIEEYKANQKMKMKIFKEEVKYFLAHLKDFFSMCGLYLIKILVSGTLAYTIYLMLSNHEFSIAKMFLFFILYQTSSYLANLTPAPGTSGGIEFSFTLAYKSVIESEYLMSVLIIYRVITYMIPLICEVIVFMFVVNDSKKVKVENKESYPQ
jgi:hypothetical protein